MLFLHIHYVESMKDILFIYKKNLLKTKVKRKIYCFLKSYFLSNIELLCDKHMLWSFSLLQGHTCPWNWALPYLQNTNVTRYGINIKGGSLISPSGNSGSPVFIVKSCISFRIQRRQVWGRDISRISKEMSCVWRCCVWSEIIPGMRRVGPRVRFVVGAQR